MQPRFTYVADHALLVGMTEAPQDVVHRYVLGLDRALEGAMPFGAIETVPALVNLLISFDPLQTDHKTIEAHIRALWSELSPDEVTGTTHRVGVCYDPPYAPDLHAVADATGLTPEAVINSHLAGDFQVLMYGFAPGYAYLGGTPADIQVQRKPAPVRDVPDGSVIIAGPQCLITTLTMPTGWSIIGRTAAKVLTGDTAKPFLFDVGDRVVFERINAATLEAGDG